jgi:hypothetical protein
VPYGRASVQLVSSRLRLSSLSARTRARDDSDDLLLVDPSQLRRCIDRHNDRDWIKIKIDDMAEVELVSGMSKSERLS